MPIKGFICPDNERISVKHCLAECRMQERCCARPYLKAISTERVWNGKISTTTAFSGAMENFLTYTKDFWIDPYDSTAAIFGTKAHANIESAVKTARDDIDGKHSEMLFEDEYTTGIPDYYDAYEHTLIDYKTSGSWKVAQWLGYKAYMVGTGVYYKSGKKEGQERSTIQVDMVDKKDFDLRMQLNKYRMFLERGGFKVKKMMCQSMPRDGGTWEAKKRGIDKKLYYFRVDYIPNEEVDKFYIAKFKELDLAMRTNGMPPICNEEERWYDDNKCKKYCKVAKYCPHGQQYHK